MDKRPVNRAPTIRAPMACWAVKPYESKVLPVVYAEMHMPLIHQ